MAKHGRFEPQLATCVLSGLHFFPVLRMSMEDHKSAVVLIWGLQINCSE